MIGANGQNMKKDRDIIAQAWKNIRFSQKKTTDTVVSFDVKTVPENASFKQCLKDMRRKGEYLLLAEDHRKKTSITHPTKGGY